MHVSGHDSNEESDLRGLLIPVDLSTFSPQSVETLRKGTEQGFGVFDWLGSTPPC